MAFFTLKRINPLWVDIMSLMNENLHSIFDEYAMLKNLLFLEAKEKTFIIQVV